MKNNTKNKSRPNYFRLCLVAVKRFSKNTYFSEMLIFEEGKYFCVFGCISKNFPKNIFWCLEKKKEKTKPRKTLTKPKRVGAIDGGEAPFARSTVSEALFAISRSVAQRSARSRSTARSREAPFASIAISRRVIRAPTIAWSREWCFARRRLRCRSDRCFGSTAWSELHDWRRVCELSRSPLRVPSSGNHLKWK